MKVILISGLSGSGKSIALKSLEDLGYFCVDNLPMLMLPELVLQVQQRGGEEALAVSIDIRSVPSFDGWAELLEFLRAQGHKVAVLFTEAEDEILLKRFSETRRSHPLARRQSTLKEALNQERRLMNPVRESAFVLDTSRMSVQQLRQFVKHWLQIDTPGLSLVFQSFGFKYGLPSDVNFVFDVRSLANPYYDPALREFTGRDAEIKAFFADYKPIWRMIDDIGGFLTRWLPLMQEENRMYISVGIGCTGGQHRSVFVVEELARRFPDYPVLIRHRQLDFLESVRTPRA